MRRVLFAVIVLALQSASAAQSTAVRPQPADAVVRLLEDLQKALQRGRAEDLRALASDSLPAADAAQLARTVAGGPATGAVVRERGRRSAGSGYEVLAIVLTSRGRVGRIATWLIAAQPRGTSSDRYELTAFTEVAALDSLLELNLDTTKQFAVKNLSLELTDLSLKMHSGVAYVAESENGVTAMVLRGKGEVVFSPSDPAEQTQLRLFNGGRAPLSTVIDSAFLRLNPGEFAERISSASLTASPRVDQDELRRAEEIFADLAPRSYNLDLRELTSERWFLEPSYGNFVVEFRSNASRLADLRPVAERSGRHLALRSHAQPEHLDLRLTRKTQDAGPLLHRRHGRRVRRRALRHRSDVRSAARVHQRARHAARQDPGRRRRHADVQAGAAARGRVRVVPAVRIPARAPRDGTEQPAREPAQNGRARHRARRSKWCTAAGSIRNRSIAKR